MAIATGKPADAARISPGDLPGRPSVLLYEAHPHLAGAPDIFAGLSASEHSRIIHAGVEIGFAAGDHLFRQGEPHDGIFVLLSGILRSYYVAPNGREITLAAWPKGNFAGGPEIVGGGVHVWSGVALQPGRALHLAGAVIPALMREAPNFALGLVNGLAFKGKCYSALLQMLGTRSVTERLALVLLNLAVANADGSLSLPGPMPHEELAAFIGGTRQWVSMTIERFRRRGLVDLQDRRLVILSSATLRSIADGH